MLKLCHRGEFGCFCVLCTVLGDGHTETVPTLEEVFTRVVGKTGQQHMQCFHFCGRSV